MWPYVLRRLLLVPPTLLIILLINFALVQFAPGGPIETLIGQMKHHGGTSEAGGSSASVGAAGVGVGLYSGVRGIDDQLREQLKVQFGFDKPPAERFIKMVWQYLQFDFGTSYFLGRSVWQVLAEKLPVSIALGVASTIPVYLIGVPLGVAKAVRNGSKFDVISSTLLTLFYAIPPFLLAVMLLMFFAGGTFVHWFPLRGLMSDNAETLPLWQRMLDIAHHLVLPALAMGLGHLASITLWIKNSFIEEVGKQYTLTARAKGASPRRVLYGHVFRNASIILLASLPATLLGMFFTGNVLIETLFSLDGLGLLGYESAMRRDYAVVFATLYIFTLLGLFINLMGDLLYAWVDPRISFNKQG